MFDFLTILSAALVATAFVLLWEYLSDGEMDCDCGGDCNQGRNCPLRDLRDE
jgi:hypothetical protein